LANQESNSKQKITVSKNGPYIVTGKIPIVDQIIGIDSAGVPIEWRAGKKYPLQEKCGLCRCGQSKNMPFCDGTHVKIKFDGSETAADETYLNETKEIDGPTLKLMDIEILCASARFCHRASGIWNLVPQSQSPEARQTAVEEAADCPSGRLCLCDKKNGEWLEPKFDPSIGLIEDPQMGVRGPIWVRGNIPVESGDGRVYRVRNRVTLCRCGKSTIKPFCDSSHYPEDHEH